ncbi:MAG: hypothetical protein ACEY3F_03180 [Wolbachia sp.]
MFQNSSLVIPVPSPVIPVHDTGIQVAHKQTSIESGYNGFDEIAERLDPSVSYSDDTILFPGSQCLGTGMTRRGQCPPCMY